MSNHHRALPKIVIASLQLLLLLSVLHTVTFGDAATEGLDPNAWPPCSLRDPLMDPTYERRYGTHMVWQIPPNPKGVLFMGHGGGSQVVSYFDPGPNCPQCYGLPEVRRMVLEALRRGYAVIVVKSVGNTYDCYWPLESSRDVAIVTAVLEEWTRDHALDGLPLAVLGQSAGVYIASALFTRLPVRAMVLIESPGMSELIQTATPPQFPPTFYLEMPLDKGDPNLNWTAKMAEAMGILKSRGVEVTHFQVWPRPLDPLVFSERILCMSDEMSRELFEGFEAAGWLDGDRYVVLDPREQDYRFALRRADALPFCRESGDRCLVEHVKEEMNNLYARHSYTSDANDAIFSWLDTTLFSTSFELSLVRFDL